MTELQEAVKRWLDDASREMSTVPMMTRREVEAKLGRHVKMKHEVLSMAEEAGATGSAVQSQVAYLIERGDAYERVIKGLLKCGPTCLTPAHREAHEALARYKKP